MAKSLDDATAEIERIADAIMAAEYMLVCAGPNFDDASSNPFDSEYCVSSLISKPNKFMGFWGEFYNEYLDKVPHEGYNVVSKFRDKLFSADDIRKRNKKTKGDIPGEEDQFIRFMVYTGHVGNSFQKSGIPDQEMMEVCGNITQWQCGVNPICCARVFGIERGFKFYIDPLTRDALPLKYIPVKQQTPSIGGGGGGSARKQRGGAQSSSLAALVDSDEEERNFRRAVEKGEGLGFAKGATPEDKARRLQRLRDYARVVRLSRQIQLLDDRFPDLFTGFVTNVGGSLETYTFDGLTSSSSAASGGLGLYGGAFTSTNPHGAVGEGINSNSTHGDEHSNSAHNKGGKQGKDKSSVEAQQLPPKPPCADPLRVSHLLAHVNALDRRMYATHRGIFSAIEADKWRAERDAAFVALTKSPMAMESHSVSSRREKVTRYNVSLALTSASGEEEDQHLYGGQFSSPHQSHGSEDWEGALGVKSLRRPHVLPQPLRERLLKPYPNGPAGAEEEERVIDELAATEMKDWSQSSNGWYYFSNVKLTRTQQEPVNNSYSDYIQIEVPRGDYRLPLKGSISLVCETAILAEGEHVPTSHTKMMAAAAGGGGTSGGTSGAPLHPNPYVYTTNVWQIVGMIDTTRASATVSGIAGGATVGGAGAVSTGASGGTVGKSTSTAATKDAFEYVLEGRRGHVLHIGSLKSSPQTITYIHLEVPHDDWPSTPMPGISSRLIRPPRDSGAAGGGGHHLYGEGFSSTAGDSSGLSPRGGYNSARSGYSWGEGSSDGGVGDSEPLVPTLNHVLCMSCREIARPYVLMTRTSTTTGGGPSSGGLLAAPKKDEGFATAVMNQRNKAYKAWEKSIVDSLKQDQNKSIVMLEVGADRKMDPARSYSEKTFKLLKSAKCTFVRLSGFNLDTKAKSGGGSGGSGGGGVSENSSQISIVCNPIMGLQAIERAVNERIKKITK